MQKILKNLQKNILLKNHTTFKIGGPAKYFFKAKTNEDLMEAIKWAKERNLLFFILGGGSNLLVSDKGFDGLTIKCQMSNVKCQNFNILSDAGAKLVDLINSATENNLSGLEWAAGIPGTIGGAIRGNVEAFGSSFARLIKKVEVYDAKKEKIKTFINKDCQFKYKDSIFKQNPDLIILSSIINLKKGETEKIKKQICDNLNCRAKNHPLNLASAGCVFKNYYNKKKLIPAGWLIEKCGLKGTRIGKTEISQKHANFIVNLGNAKAENVLNLIKIIKKKIKEKFKIELQEEIQYLRF